MDFNTSVAPPSPAALDLKPPPAAQNPLEIVAQMQEIRARNQQMKTQGLQQQELQMNLDQRKAVNDALRQSFTPQSDGTAQFDANGFTQRLGQAGYGGAAPAFVKGITDMQTSLADLAEKRQSLEAGAASRLASLVQGGGNDPMLFHSLMTAAVNSKALDASHYAPIDAAIQQAEQADQADGGQRATALVKKITDQMLSPQQAMSQAERTTAQAKADEAKTAADRLKAELPGITADAQKKKMIADMMAKAQQGQASGQHPIDAILGQLDPQAAAAYKPAYDAAMAGGGPEAAKSVLEAAAQHAGQISADLNPARRQAKVDDAVKTEQALTPVKVNQAVQTEIEKAKQSPDAFATVIDPGSRQKAISDFEKSSNEYADKIGAAGQLADFVKAAQSGNKAAPGLIPIAEVRQLVNRVNRQELESASGSAGSALDRLQGFIGKYTEGQPIPPAVLKDISSISDTMKSAAQRTYGMKVEVNRKTYGSKVQPIDQSGPSNLPEVKDQAAYEKLPKGAQYTFNGVVHTKQ